MQLLYLLSSYLAGCYFVLPVMMLTCLFLILICFFPQLLCCLLPFFLHIKLKSLLPAVFSFCYLPCCLSLSFALPGRAMIKTLALSLIWYLVPALLPSQYSRNHLVETISNYTFLLFSRSHFVEEMKNGIFLFFRTEVSTLLQWPFRFLNTAM